MISLDRFRGCLLGLACGDAVGVSCEFMPRGSFEPLTGMNGGGPFDLKPGEWTDDTSMALCLATSLVESKDFNPLDQMERYLDWYENGTLSSIGECFDIGNTTRDALMRFRQSGEPFSGSTDPYSAGNGSLMRLAPVVLKFFPDRIQTLHFCAESSRTTHGAEECLDACRLFGDMLLRALGGEGKDAILAGGSAEMVHSHRLADIARGTYRDKTMDELRGTGYVVECLEAALWCFWRTDSFEEAILAAANLGDDADTTAAVCGQLAGAYYGKGDIPADWLDKLVMKEEISALAEKLAGTELRE
ncbi:ADP-ribosylglycohydrolase family protein [Chloroflexota bacterium]